MSVFTPLTDYTGYRHVLGAAACFVHPGNGNIYFTACEQVEGIRQDLSVYRIVATGQMELVKRYRGTVDSPSQITMGGAVISRGGALFVATSLVIPGVPKVTVTGWQGSWIREPNIDAPWRLPDLTAIEQRITQIEQQLVGIETALANLSQGGIDAGDREALDRLRVMLRI